MSFGVLMLGLGLTWLVEWATVAVILRRSDGQIALGVLLVNALTQPPATAAVRELGGNFWVIELLVCAVEVLLYRLLVPRVSWRQAGLISLVGNSLTASLSFLL
jgi:hypothetical protein